MRAQQNTYTLNQLFRIILVLAILAYALALFYVWQVNLESFRYTLRQSNSVLSQGVRTTLKGHELILRGLGEELIKTGVLQSPENGRELIERMKNIDPGMAGFGLARADGQLLIVSGINAGQPLPNLATYAKTRDSFKEVLDSKSIRTGRPYFFEALKNWVVPIRVPIFNQQQELIAVMAAGYDITHATASWTNHDMPKGYMSSLMRDDGFLIFSQPLLPGNGQDAYKRTYGEAVSAETLLAIRSLNQQEQFSYLQMPRVSKDGYYVHYRYLPEYALHVGVLAAKDKVFSSWVDSIKMPTLLFIIFLLGGHWIFHRARQQQQKSNQQISNLLSWQTAVLNGAQYSIISTDTAGTIVSFNSAAEKLLGYQADEVVGKLSPEVFHDTEELTQQAKTLSRETGQLYRPGFKALVARAQEHGIDEQQYTFVQKDGTRIPVFLSITPIRDENQLVVGYLGVAANIAEKLVMMKNLQQSELRYHALFDSASDAIFLMLDDQFVDCNPSTLNMFGVERDQIIGSTPQRFSPEYQPDGQLSAEAAHEKIQAAFDGKPQTFEWQHQKYNGQLFNAEVSLNVVDLYDQPHLLATVRDITERKVYEQELNFQAHHDSLTGLPNRMTLHETFKSLAEDALQQGHSLALMLIDLDRFKDVNDTLGHHAGDEVLLQIGSRLRSINQAKDSLFARLGGDEFAVIVRIDPALTPEQLAKSFVESLREPFETSSMKVRVGASIGIACFPEHGDDSHELLRAADVAMYQAKNLSSGVKLYDQQSDVYSKQRLSLASELTQAIEQQQLILHYQPKISVQSREVSGFEALVRWQHPERGLLYPDAFIDLVEMSDLIQQFSQAVIKVAVAGKKKLSELGYSQPVAINLSARNLTDQSCVNTLKAALQEHALPAEQIELELTESALMNDRETAIEMLQQFKKMGVNTAIDDFGTGYSSLSYLRKLPVSAMKIDRSFVMSMLENSHDCMIVRSTITLAHSLELKVVAEGVEQQQILGLLKSMECDFAQGYGICKPVDITTLLQWLAEHEDAN